MIRLIKAELLRLVSRRITFVASLLALLAVAGLATIFAITAKPPSDAEIAAGQEVYRQVLEQAEKDCELNPPPEGLTCEDYLPQEEWFIPVASTFAEVAGMMTLAATAFVAVAMIIIAASLVGADFSVGSLSTWLSFEPRRGRVFASRAIVTVVALAIIGAVIIGAVMLGLGVAVRAMQGPGSVTPLTDTVLACARGVGLVGVAALCALALAFLTRRTIAVIGIAFGYLVARLVLTIFSLTEFYGRLQPWLPETNALAVLHGATSYQVYQEEVTDGGIQYSSQTYWIGWEHGLLYLGVATLVLVAAAVITFRRRDLG